MDAFANKVLATCQRYGLLEPNDKVIVAVSGGADSTALLLALHVLAPLFDLSLKVAHLNHLMRGEQAEADAQWVKDLATELGLPFYRRDTDVPALISERGLTVEQAGRVARYDFFEDLIAELQADKVAVGQTQDDQAETVFLHLLRGSGLAGIAGVRPIRPAGQGWIIRPLLGITRRETEAYTKEHNLIARHDPYNVDLDYFRNRIRYQLLPWLKENANPNIKQIIARSAAIWQQEDELLADLTDRKYDQLVRRQADAVELPCSDLLKLPLALQRRILRQAFAAIAGDERNLSYDHTEKLLSLARMPAGKAIDLPRSVQGVRIGTCLRIQAQGTASPDPVEFCRMLPVPGRLTIEEADIEVQVTVNEPELGPSPASGVLEGYFDFRKTGSALCMRSRRAGDWFYPQGAGGRKKLKDFFIDQKIPRWRRDLVPVVTTSDGQIIWVAGYRTDSRFLVDDSTENILYIRIRDLNSHNKQKR